ncbi:hypothetical protein [Phenylobacterium sp. SCN 70-31]|uniref:hypothetical protein n=1 Tax=Phenylobacterium sp. SCN 70-31 TaxID=1660129 RepID=UPI0025E743D9|nr:hypothetical protein [Phenylobacterium sp. SCN 70-31]
MIATRARRRAAAGVLAAAALSGCATSRVSVVERGDSATALAAGAAFRMAPAGDPADASVRAALAERLIGLGLVERDPRRGW